MRDDRHMTPSAIAIVGMAGRFPGAPTLDRFWQNVATGTESITVLSRDQLRAAGVPENLIDHPDYVAAAPLLEGFDLFDAELFQYGPQEATVIDPQQRVFLEIAREALEVSGHLANLEGRSIGVFGGSGGLMSSYLLSDLHFNRGLTGPTASAGHIGNDKDFLCTRISYKLDLRGPSVTIQTACSTSLVAVHMACQSLLAGECDIALAGGVAIRVPQYAGYLHQKDGILSPDGHCRPFDAKARGTLFGSGAGVVVLRPLGEALSDGDNIRAVILGSAIANDGARKTSFWATRAEGQIAAIRGALAVAEVDSATIGLVEAHGTGTLMGDPVEIMALDRAYRAESVRAGRCAVGSVKANIGHLEAAAGIAGLIKAVLALEHREIPPAANFDTANPKIDFSSTPFEILRECRSWEGPPRRAAVNSLGVGGTNVHVILEESPFQAARPQAPERPELLVLTARTRERLGALARSVRDHVADDREENLRDICYTALRARPAEPHRIAITAKSQKQAADTLDAYLRGWPAKGLIKAVADQDGGLRVAFLFAGQGTQYTDMCHGLYKSEPSFRAELERCGEILEQHLDRPLMSLLYGPPEETLLHRTAYAQPAIFALEWSLAQLWMSWGVRPQALLGHSVGEYVAACLAGVFDLEDGLAFVAARGRIMDALPSGTVMAAVMTDKTSIEEAIAGSGRRVAIAAENAPRTVVIAGTSEDVSALADRLSAQGVASIPLVVSHAFHSHLMDPILDAFETVAGRVAMREPSIPLISNVTGMLCRPGEIASPGYWVRQLRSTVQFRRGVEALAAQGIDCLLEIGPQSTLLGLARQCLGGAAMTYLPSLDPSLQDRETMLASAGQLFAQGANIDLLRIYPNGQHRIVPLPPTPLQRKRYWIESAATKAPDTITAESPLGTRLSLPLSDEVRFEWRIKGEQRDMLADHRIFGQIVVPAAYYVSQLIAAARALWDSPHCHIRDLVFRQAVSYATGAEPLFQLVLVPSDGARCDFRFVVCPASADSTKAEHSWTVCCEGRIEPLVEPEDSSNKPAAFGCAQRSGSDYYAELATLGYDLGPGFRWIDGVFDGAGHGGRLQTPPTTGSYEDMHPGLIDGCYQLALVPKILEMHRAPGSVLVPFEISEIRVRALPHSRGPFICRVEEQATGQEAVAADLDVWAGDPPTTGPFLSIGRLVARPASRERLHGAPMGTPVFEVAWQDAAPLTPSASISGGHWLVLTPNDGSGRRLADALSKHGATTSLVFAGSEFKAMGNQCFVVNPGRPEHFDAVLDALATDVSCRTPNDRRRPRLAGIVHLWGLSVNNPVAPEHAISLGAGAMIAVVQRLLRRTEVAGARLVTVTRNVWGQHGAVADNSAMQAPQWGLARVIALEHPEFRCLAIDVADEALASMIALACEIVADERETDVALGGSSRRVARLTELPLPALKAPYTAQPGRTYLITGGLGALGLRLAEWLAERGARSLALIGRRGRVETEPQRATLARLEARGVRVRVESCDVTDAAALGEVINSLTEGGTQLCGVYHLAGQVDDATLSTLTLDRLHRVIRPKLLGAWNLHTLTQGMPLDCFVMFSSVASLFGTAGQGNYAAANAFLDALAHQRRAQGLPALSINWGPWAEAGMAARLGEEAARRRAAQGIGDIAPEAGLRMMERLLSDQGVTQAMVSPIDWRKFLAGDARPFFETVGERRRPQVESDVLSRLKESPPDKRQLVLTSYVATQVAKAVGLASADVISPDQRFMDLGIDSLIAIELRNRLQSNLGVDIPLQNFAGATSLAQLVSLLLEQLTLASIATALPGRIGEDMEEMAL
jgi:acyl transferase domain-containing protein/NAD(P)-dependent dehydrogenase (short-subunit alcohol dehydrogenase family)/acyl carrier protein